MTEARHVALPELREIISDPDELVKGMHVLDMHGLSRLARAGNKLFCDARGASPMPYKVSIILTEGSSGIRARCTCMAARSRPFCKHSAALLVAWARAPEAFAVSDRPPEGAFVEGAQKKKSVKRGKTTAAELGRAGVEQVVSLSRELAVAGVASVSESRIEQMRSLGDNLRELRLRRLSGRTLSLAGRLEECASDPAALDPLAYTSSVADMLLTARKLARHFDGEPLEPRHVEELIGKTWRKTDRTPAENLELIEYAFFHRISTDDYVIRESRFLDVRTGVHYSEKQILPGFIAKRTEPKKTHAGRVLENARGSIYPGFAPHRLDLASTGVPRPLDQSALAAALAQAHADIGAALGAFQSHRKDLFAPDRLPLAIRVETVLATGRRAQIIDAHDRALFLPENRSLFDRLTAALEHARLCGLFGEAMLEGALPTFYPFAAVVERSGRLELANLQFGSAFSGTRKVKVDPQRSRGSAPWISAARDSGASEAAVALGEIREELASMFITGLGTLTERVAEPIALRLRELNLVKQAELLLELSRRPEAGVRLEDFVKVFSVLEIAVVRLIAAAHIDRSSFVQVPLHESLFVSDVENGTTRWESAVRLTRSLETAPDEKLVDFVFPHWADGSATPFIAHALRTRGAAALALAARVLAERRGKTTRLTALKVLAALDMREARDRIAAIAAADSDETLRLQAAILSEGTAKAQIAADRPARNVPRTVEQLTALLMNAARAADRAAAAEALGEHPRALSTLRLSYAGDVSAEVRTAAARALGRLRDPQMVQTFIDRLADRNQDSKEAEIALQGLIELGDIRAEEELERAQSERFKPQLTKKALAAITPPELSPQKSRKRGRIGSS